MITNKQSALIEAARRNGRRAVTNAFIMSLAGFLLPVWQLFYTLQLGMSLTQAMVLMASSWIVTGLMNVPTGVWADKFGRLKLFRIGVALNAAAYVPMFFTHTFWALLLASILAGFAVSMLDGSLEANAMDSYERAGLTKTESARFGSSQMTAAYLGRILSGVVGAWLYTQWAFAPLVLDIVILTVVFVQSYMIMEIRAEKPSQLPNWHFMQTMMSLVRAQRILIQFMLVTLLVSVGCESFWAAFQQYLTLRNVPTVQFGVVYAVIAASSALSSWAYRHIHTKLTWMQISLATMVLMTGGMLLSHVIVTGLQYVVAVIIGLGFGLIFPLAYDVIQRNVRSQYRSTITSLRQLVYLCGFGAATIAVGRYADLYGRETMLNIITVQIVVSLAILLGMMVRESAQKS